jgi:hypothetical protein
MVLVFVPIFLFLKRSLLLDFSFNPSCQKHFWFRSILRACMGSVIAHKVKLCTVNRWTWPIGRPTHEQCNSISEMYTSFQVRTATFLVSNLLDICQLSFQDLNQRWLSLCKAHPKLSLIILAGMIAIPNPKLIPIRSISSTAPTYLVPRYSIFQCILTAEPAQNRINQQITSFS